MSDAADNRHRSAIRVEIPSVPSLQPADRDRMRELFRDYFANVAPEDFDRDLSEKEWALVLRRSDDGAIVGFSTLSILQTTAPGGPATAFFSGDTVIDPAHWGARGWLGPWLKHAFEVAAERRLPTPIHWLLLTSTHKSYRFLPAFLREYYPQASAPIPSDKALIRDALARLKFPDEYDPMLGVVRLAKPTPIRRPEGVVPDRLRSDPHVDFFLKANPDYAQGHFLVCLAELSMENLTRLGRRLLLGAQPQRLGEEE